MDKYRGLQSGAASAATTAAGVASTGDAPSGAASAVPTASLLASGATPVLNNLKTVSAVPATPMAPTPALDASFDLEKAAGDAPNVAQGQAADVSAADYDPDRENEGDGAHKPILVDAPKALENVNVKVEEESEEEIEVEEDDDEFDMFADILDEDRPKKLVKKRVKKATSGKPKVSSVLGDGWQMLISGRGSRSYPSSCYASGQLRRFGRLLPHHTRRSHRSSRSLSSHYHSRQRNVLRRRESQGR